MIRLSWLQFRSQAVVAVVALLAMAIPLAITGRQIAHLYDTTVLSCSPGNCAAAYGLLRQQQSLLQMLLGPLLLVVPALIGIFWGAPLVARELEAHTDKLAWTQSITRTRWLAAKLGVAGLTSMAAAGLLSLMVTWWFKPFDLMHGNRFSALVFDARDIVPIGYAAFAFALGVTAGVLLRRTLAAMAVTLVVFLGARLAINYGVRPHLMAPAHTSVPLNAAGDLGFAPSSAGVTFMAGNPQIANAWTLSSTVVDKNGHAATPQMLHQFLQSACPAVANPPAAGAAGRGPASQTVFNDCIAQLSSQFHLAVTYQPANRYWTFQWLELALFIGLALVLAAACLWLVRRRLA